MSPLEHPHSKYMHEALTIADLSMQKGGGPFGAVIVKENEIIASGSNLVVPENDPVAHAEIVAIRKACRQQNHFELKDCILYSSCEPCPMCLGAVYWARMASVFFSASRENAAKSGFDDHFIYREFAQNPEDRKIPMHTFMTEEGSRIFEKWDNLSNKSMY